jgi:hypothetical protein
MSLASRIEKLEEKLIPQEPGCYWLMWRGCTWIEAEGVIRNENESIESFKTRVLLTTNKKFIWVR